jgi:tellurite resistance protein TerC
MVLIFVGIKIMAVNVIGKMPASISLGVTFGLLIAGVLYSLYRTRTGSPVASKSAV